MRGAGQEARSIFFKNTYSQKFLFPSAADPPRRPTAVTSPHPHVDGVVSLIDAAIALACGIVAAGAWVLGARAWEPRVGGRESQAEGWSLEAEVSGGRRAEVGVPRLEAGGGRGSGAGAWGVGGRRLERGRRWGPGAGSRRRLETWVGGRWRKFEGGNQSSSRL